MSHGVTTLIFPVKDAAKTKALYSALLGAEPIADTPYYVGWRVGDQDIGLDPNGHKQGMTAPIAYVHVDDIRQTLQRLVDAGATVKQDVRDVGGGKLIAWVQDPDGNVFGLTQ